MYAIKKAMFLKALTSIHAGSGSELGVIDLPIQRERHTGFPKIEASSLKGSLRDAVVRQEIPDETINQIFGVQGIDGSSASAVAFSDVRLLFFPVRSAKGVFALVTCPMVLQRFLEDMKLLGVGKFDLQLDSLALPTTAHKDTLVLEKNKVLLEEYTYEIGEAGNESFREFLKELPNLLPEPELARNELLNRAMIVSDDDFSDFVQMSTEVVTRIKIDSQTRTVDAKVGGLFNEEYLPTESMLYSMIFVTDSYQPSSERLTAKQIAEKLEKCVPSVFQIGANLTLGKGFVATSLASGGDNHGQHA